MQLVANSFSIARFCAGHKFLLLVLIVAFQVNSIAAQRSCYQCEGINCQRTTYQKVEKCSNDVDICATVFEGQTIQAQGCMENLAENLRSKCSSDDVDALNECHKCNGNLCNKWAANSFQCIQCDSATDSNCINNAEILEPARCPISRTPNQYCYTAKDGNRLVRGCTSSLEQQKTCMSSEDCVICDPGELSACNNMRADGGDNPVTPTPNPNPSAGAVIDLSVANYVIALFAAYICKYL